MLMFHLRRSSCRHSVHFFDKMYVVNVVIHISTSLFNRLIHLLLTLFSFSKFFPESMLNIGSHLRHQAINIAGVECGICLLYNHASR